VAGRGVGVNEDSNLFQSGASEDFGDAAATSGHGTTAKLRMTSHRPMIYPQLLAGVCGTYWRGPQSYRNAGSLMAPVIRIGLNGSVFWIAGRDRQEAGASFKEVKMLKLKREA
jgi:hypothetical protein